MMTSIKNSRDLGYHFDLFWTYLWWVRYLPSLKWIGQVLLEKTLRGVILAPRSDTADPNSKVEIGLITDVMEKMLWLANTCLKTDHKSWNLEVAASYSKKLHEIPMTKATHSTLFFFWRKIILSYTFMKIEIFYSISIFKYTSWILVVKIISLWIELETKTR